MIKKKLLALTLAAAFAMPSLYAAYSADTVANTSTTDDATDIQTVNITVPEIALLDITGDGTDQSVITITVPETAITDAGTGFGSYTETEVVTYALSSNVASTSGATSTTRTLDVAMTGSLPAGAKLTIISTTGTEIGDTITHTTASTALQSSGTAVTSSTLATGIKNVTLNNGNLDYTLEPIDANGMMSFTGTDGTTAEAITLTYTLSADS